MIKNENYQVIFGSNTVLNSTGYIDLLKGTTDEPFKFSRDKYGNLILNCTIRDKKGKIVVELVDSIINHIDDDYEVDDFEEYHVKIINKSTKDVWLEFQEISANKVKLNGKFYVDGHKIVATDECLLIGGGMRICNTTKNNFDELVTFHKGGGMSI